jgi:hypothetical protein
MSENQNPPRERRPTFNAIRRVYQPKAGKEQCDLCSVELHPIHPHLIEPQTRQILCACEACAILFSTKSGSQLRRIPQRVRFLSEFKMPEEGWDGMLIPVGMAFFFYNSQAGKVSAYYPSPAGATESLLSLEAWDVLVQENPILSELEPDVEALLVNRLKNNREYFLAPIDKCYELVGLIRVNWRGLSGGTEVWEAIGKFYEELKTRAGSFSTQDQSTKNEAPHA